MARFEERDPRWIVEERQDGTNVKNWHWTEKDCVTVKVTEVKSVAGDAFINNRKNKIFASFELNLKLGYSGEVAGTGSTEKGEGMIEIPNFSDEQDPEDWEFRIKPKTEDSVGHRLKQAIQKDGRSQLRSLLETYVKELKLGVPVHMAHVQSKEEATEKLTKSTEKPKRSVTSTVPGCRELRLTERYHANAQDIFDCFTIAGKLQTFTQSPAKVEAVVGGAFSWFDGAVSGQFLELHPPTKLIFSWRFNNWAEGHFSRVMLELVNPESGLTQLSLHQTEIPEEDRYGHSNVLEVTETGEMVEMRENVRRLCAWGKGILASDESTGTIGKRFEKVGLTNDEETRRRYRELFYTANVGDYYSGAILYKETLYQNATDGTAFVQCLERQGIQPGIKVDEVGSHRRPLVIAKGKDQGLVPIEGTDGETETKGLEHLAENLERYKEQGATFTKWRAALKLGNGCPSDRAIELNAVQLAEYAALSQMHGLVPIVEPEILLDGTQSMDEVCTASARVLSACIAELWKRPVVLEDCLLKPQMMNGVPSIPGDKSQHVAQETLRILQRYVPPAIPGIMFLSGGQSEAEASLNLCQINKAALNNSKAPWRLSFSYGRALQSSVLEIWSEDMDKNSAKAQRKAEELAQVNAAASKGIDFEVHPSVLSSVANLNETFRGWSTS